MLLKGESVFHDSPFNMINSIPGTAFAGFFIVNGRKGSRETDMVKKCSA